MQSLLFLKTYTYFWISNAEFRLKTETLLFARQNSRVILAHLLCWQGFGICQYAGTLAALHLHQTDAMQYSGHLTAINLDCFSQFRLFCRRWHFHTTAWGYPMVLKTAEGAATEWWFGVEVADGKPGHCPEIINVETMPWSKHLFWIPMFYYIIPVA